MLPHEWEENHKGVRVCKHCRVVMKYCNVNHGCSVLAAMLLGEKERNKEEVRWARKVRRRIMLRY